MSVYFKSREVTCDHFHGPLLKWGYTCILLESLSDREQEFFKEKFRTANKSSDAVLKN